MRIEEYPLGGQVGTIVMLDAPGDLDTMHHLVSTELSSVIKRYRQSLFIQVVFTEQPRQPSQRCLVQDNGWYPVQKRDEVHASNMWHAHQGVVLYCPQQKEAVVPTIVTTDQLLYKGREQSGISVKEERSREAQRTLQAAVEAFESDFFQPSGHTLIIPPGVTHKKKTVPQGSGLGGVLQRRTFH